MRYINNGMLYKNFIHKNGNLAVCINMDGLQGHYAKRSKSERKRYLMTSHTWNLKLKI